jgi:hypothetical protein
MDIIAERDKNFPIWQIKTIRYNQRDRISWFVRFPDGSDRIYKTYEGAMKAYKAAVRHAVRAVDR